MKNLFKREKENNAFWLSGFAIGLLSAGTIAWIFYLKYAAERKALAEQTDYHEQHKLDYMNPKPAKKPRTNIKDLAHPAQAHLADQH